MRQVTILIIHSLYSLHNYCDPYLYHTACGRSNDWIIIRIGVEGIEIESNII